MTWSDFYLFCFLVGVLLSVFSFLAGAIHLHLPFKMHLHLHGQHGAGHAGSSHISWFNASTGMAFLAWFGGVGYLMTKYSHLETLLIVAAATGSGAFAGWIVLRFLLKLVGTSDKPLHDEERRVIGSIGTVSLTIRENGTGEIIFPLGGGRRCSGARAENGEPIEKGAEVVIERYEKGIAYVKRWEEFMKS
ncbi:MAG TPA: NfeD family protein [Candidatus Eisenbacteria bacterium]|nr:NfeD family protein [Candidatus Eisenbacteria bacterium]